MTVLVPCVGAVVLDPAGRLLLVRRANPPAQGTWSLPGGRVEPGEEPPVAVAREVLEETGLVVAVAEHVGSVRRDGPGGVLYDIADYRCTVTGGDLRAGDDASDAGWFDVTALDEVETSPGLLASLRGWHVL